MIYKIKNKLSHLFHPAQGEIWCLHRVVERRSDYPSNRDLEITPDYLEAMILQYKSDGYAFVTIDQILAMNRILPAKRINISFDDGFRDVYINAFPLFKKYGIPFTIYLTTDFPEGKADMWWIQMENNYSVDEFEELMNRIYENDKPMVRTMHELTKTRADYILSQSLALSWTELKEMVDSGLCTIGSHTVSHPGLTRLNIDECRDELVESKRLIKEKLGVDAIHFSYPHSMQNTTIQTMVKDAHYVSAILGYGGCVRKGDNMFCLHRKYVIQK